MRKRKDNIMNKKEALEILSKVTYSSSVDGRTRNLPPHVQEALVEVLINVEKRAIAFAMAVKKGRKDIKSGRIVKHDDIKE